MLALGPLAAFMSSVTWALGSSAYAKVAVTTPPAAINFTRASLALPLFLIALLMSADRGWYALLDVTWGHLGWLASSMLASYVIGDIFFLFSTVMIGVPAALAIASAYPLWSALAGWICFGEALTVIQMGAVLVVVGGVMTVILSGARLERRAHFVRGIGFAVLTSFCWALNTVSVARGGVGIDPNAANVVRMAMAVVLCPLVGRALTGRFTFVTPLSVLRRYGWIFVAESFGGSFCFVYALTHTPLAIAAALSSLAPVIATPLAWFGKHEPVSLLKFAGIILVVTGAYWLTVV